MIVETKFYVPKMKGTIVDRHRLIELLNEGLHTKLTLITAPAGYGKSTLLSEWTASVSLTVAWVSFDENDNDLIRFWANTIASLRMISHSFEHFSIADVEMDPTGKALIAKLINHLNRSAELTVIVWDDFHLIDNAVIVNSIQYFLQYMPSSVHLYVTSRVQPSLPLSRMKLEGTVIVIDEQDLRFNRDETEQFLMLNTKQVMRKMHLTAIHEKTEGWVAGLRIFVMLINHSEKANQDELILEFSGSQQSLSEYFLEEIFLKGTSEMQQFLLNTSILNRLNAELINQLMDVQTGAEQMRRLTQENIFVISLDDQQKWYRYHHLFQHFLRQKLVELFPDEYLLLHLKAAEWFEKNDYLREAIYHYLEGNHYHDAMRVLEQVVPTLIQTELKTINHWLEKIPDQVLFQNPGLLMSRIFVLYMMGEQDVALEKISAVLAIPELPEELQASFQLLQVTGTYFTEDYERFIELSEKYVEAYPETSNLLGLDQNGELSYPKWPFMGNIPNLSERKHIIERSINIWAKSNMHALVSKFKIGLVEILYEWNRIDEAEAMIIEVMELSKLAESKVLFAHASIILEKIYRVKGQTWQAEAVYRKLGVEVSRKGYSELIDYCETHHTYLLLLSGDINAAQDWLAKYYLLVTDSISETMLLEYNLFALLLTEQGDREQAITLFPKIIDAARQEDRRAEYIRLLMQYSIFLAKDGQLAQSFDLLEESLFLGQRDGYLRTFIDGGEESMTLLKKYEETRKKQYREQKYHVDLSFVEKILSMKGGHQSLKARQKIADVQLTEKESHVLQLLATSLSNKEIASELCVSMSTIKTHINHIYRKLDVQSRLEAIERARQLRLLPWN